ncbi:hypothetical protein BC939DRAFT_477284 [Gamsiella multidivaricata]|uniref:uncharacterized protein n=1 Tax=Gamsiella multidivaricata TaxID=101098 RepID=UPI00221ECE4E|nr:uncharacterized protein BC939DRAFT_477284 [Gamsiella multidivaricata]KAI7823387.1 hypothetical protein BC939DRAFT_477284 [Gamsiella multidivaricata]
MQCSRGGGHSCGTIEGDWRSWMSFWSKTKLNMRSGGPIKMDEAHYVESQRASSNIAPRLQRFSTQDYNTILERCEDLEDWVNGFKIAQILFSRYRAPKFDFQSKDGAAPNTRTIALLASIFVRSGRPSMAGYWFKSLHGRFPHPIPLDVYTAFLGQLLTTPGEIRLMQSVLDHLHKHGPKPTTTVYNNLLRAIGTQEGISRAEAFVKHMLSLGYAADRQSFRILIDTSLKELDMPRAHYWLAEYGRQGFEVIPRMLEPFMRTCIRQIIRDQGGFSTQFAAVDADSYSQEWMYKALHVIRYMSSQGIAPTATTFELLIEGLLSQGDLLQAKNVLRIMRGSPHLYTPASRTWILFFEHHLAVDDHSSAWRVLNEMRRAIETQPISYGSVPRRLYHQLFRHLLERDKLSLAERTLYELMIRENRYQPRESEVVDLIWKLDHHPEAAERVYELLYSHTEKTPAGRPKTVHSNRIMVQGPVQMAHVGVMRAKASSRNDALRDDVMRSWNAMTQYFTERQLSSGHSTTSLEEQQVMALAFEQVAKAARKSKFMERGHVSALQDRGQGANDNQTADGWDFGQIRRSLSGGLGLGLRAGYGMGDASMVAASPAVAASNGGSEAVPSALASRHLEFKGPNRMLIQQLLKRQEFLQPLLERRDKSASSTGSSAMDTTGGRDVTRFETLKSSFEWVQEHHIPIGIDGLNSYLESLLSYQNVDAAKDVVERFLLSSVPSANADAETSTTSPNTTEVASSEEGKSPVSSSSSSPLCPDVNTVRILSEHKGLIIGGLELVDRVLCKGGTELSKAWAEYMESSRGRVSPRIRS